MKLYNISIDRFGTSLSEWKLYEKTYDPHREPFFCPYISQEIIRIFKKTLLYIHKISIMKVTNLITLSNVLILVLRYTHIVYYPDNLSGLHSSVFEFIPCPIST